MFFSSKKLESTLSSSNRLQCRYSFASRDRCWPHLKAIVASLETKEVDLISLAAAYQTGSDEAFIFSPTRASVGIAVVADVNVVAVVVDS